MFIDQLRMRIDQSVQVVTPGQIASGILIAATTGSVTVRTSSYPGYNGAQDVVIRMDTIAYVRFYE